MKLRRQMLKRTEILVTFGDESWHHTIKSHVMVTFLALGSVGSFAPLS